MKSNILRSAEVIDNLIIVEGERRYALAYAFGWAWSMLSERERDVMLRISEKKAIEKGTNE